MSAISDIRKDIPIHLELASMTDRDYMNSIMQEVHAENSCVSKRVCHEVNFTKSFTGKRAVCSKSTNP